MRPSFRPSVDQSIRQQVEQSRASFFMTDEKQTMASLALKLVSPSPPFGILLSYIPLNPSSDHLYVLYLISPPHYSIYCQIRAKLIDLKRFS